ncbi:hypothetical protein T492DRAFT_838998 [Pavlovales sp. CCMP2436]|nr:hypothetical protein T492DRAFT_838998 [Pavlovales sp. CCMP2436]
MADIGRGFGAGLPGMNGRGRAGGRGRGGGRGDDTRGVGGGRGRHSDRGGGDFARGRVFLARGGGVARGRGFFAGGGPEPGSNTATKESWLRTKVDMLVDARWDTTQFLHELAGRPETLEAFKACFANIDADVAGWRVLNALMPALASREMREALNRERANLIFTQLLAPSCARAWDALGDRLSLRTDLLDVARVCFHLLGLDPERFFVLRRVCETVCERAAALPPAEEDGLREAAQMLRARLDFAVQAERAKADAADVAAEMAVDALERRRRERRFGAVGASTDEALEANGRTWRLVPPFPTEDDIPLADEADEPGVARGPAAEVDNAAGGMAPVLAPRPVLPHNRAVGAFPSLAAYLSTHYFLTREDCLAALRTGVLAQRELHEQGGEKAARGGLPVYRDARAVALAFSRRGVGWRLRFSLGGKPGGKRKSVQSSRLMTGSLLCLAEASDKAWSRPIFAVVSNRTDSLLEHHLGPFIDIEEASGLFKL